MPPAPIFARVQPESIEITEKYNYQSEAGNPLPQVSTGTSEKPNPNGVIEISIPHDGKQYITQQTLLDLHRQQRKIWTQPTPSARIGYLGFAAYGRTDLDTLLDLSQKHGVVPLSFLLQNPGLPQVTHAKEAGKLLRYQYASVIEYPYQPKPPPNLPIQLTTKYYDEQLLPSLKTDLTYLFDPDLKKKGKGGQRAQRIIEALIQPDSFLSELVFEFQLRLQLAAPVGKENDEAPPQLDQVQLYWPVTLSPQHLTLKVGDEIRTAHYNPAADFKDAAGEAHGVLEWHKVACTAPKGKSAETGLFVYQTPVMQLAIKHPGELYQEKSLAGKLTVKLNQPLSGLQVQLFSATGEQSQVVAACKTEIGLNFSIRLANHPASKIYSPYHHLYFEGVVLDDNRVSDVVTVLHDLGFEVQHCVLEHPATSHRYVVVEGKKAHSLSTLLVWILLEGMVGQTTRFTDMKGNQSYNTRVEAGHTRLYLRGQLPGDKDALLKVMRDIQCRLRNLFRHVSSVD